MLIKSNIKTLVREAIENHTTPENLGRIGIITKRFPLLKDVLVKLMSSAFVYYIKNITITAPKPTTFNITLKNGLDFDIIYNGGTQKAFTAKVSGKKFSMLNIAETQRATQSIANLLSLSPLPKEQAQAPGNVPDAGATAFNDTMGGGGFGGGNIPSPQSEIPAGVEPVPLGGESPEPGVEPEEPEEIKENLHRFTMKNLSSHLKEVKKNLKKYV